MRPAPGLAIGLICLGLALSLAGCSAAAPSAPASSAQAPNGAAARAGVAPAAPAAAPSGGATASDTASSNSTPDRMVVRTAYMELVVMDVDATLDRVSQLAQQMGGFVVSSESREQDGNRVGKTSIRVPSAKLDDALKQLGGFATKVNRQSVTNKDVTDDYVDNDARLRTLKATESQYLEIMRSARTTDDVIKIQNSLTQVRTQIEQTQARLQNIQRTTDMALISMDVVTPASVRPIQTGGFSVPDVAHDAIQGLINAVTVLAGLVIWLVVFVPIWVPIVLIIRWWRRRARRRNTPPVPPVQPTAA